MNWIQGEHSSFMDPDVRRICLESLNAARKRCLALKGSSTKGFLSQENTAMIIGVCEKYTDVLPVAKKMFDEIYYGFVETFDDGYGSSVLQEPLKLQSKHKFDVTEGKGNFANCMIFRGDLQYKEYVISVVLTMHDYNLFMQCAYTLDIVIETR